MNLVCLIVVSLPAVLVAFGFRYPLLQAPPLCSQPHHHHHHRQNHQHHQHQHQHQRHQQHRRAQLRLFSEPPGGDDAAEYVRTQLKQKEAEYTRQRTAKLQSQLKESGDSDLSSVPSLASLQLIDYINSEGELATVVVDPGTRASVYAISDEQSKVRYVGVSRNIQQSLRLHLARMPDQTYFFQCHHITKASRTLLELIQSEWVSSCGGVDGNDDQTIKKLWEGALDVKPLFTDEDEKTLSEAKFGPNASKVKEESAYKKVARRYEDEKVAILERRGLVEKLRFDPKLKGSGLLDLYTEKTKDVIPSKKPAKKG